VSINIGIFVCSYCNKN